MALRNILIALGALALIAGVTLAALRFARQPTTIEASSPAPPSPSQAILVAARPVAVGTLLRPDDIAWKEVVTGATTPENILRSQNSETEFLGAIARRDFAAGDPITAGALVKSSDRTFLAAVLSPGKRAVSIAVDAPQSAAGLVLPGDRVDVILTQSFAADAADAEHRTVGETVLSDIRVIAVDQWLMTIAKPASTAKGIGATDSQIPRTITLEATDLQAERILVAVQLGKIQLSVRALEGGGTEHAPADGVAAPVWAYDVSPALRMLRHEPPAAVALLAPVPPVVGIAPAAETVRVPPKTRSPIEVMHGSKTELR